MGLGKKILLVTLLIVSVASAQVPPGPGLPPVLPIDFGVIPMLGLAIAYGVKKLKK